MLNRITKALEGIVTDKQINLLGLTIEPDSPSRVLVCACNGMEQKKFDRQYSLLVGYICLALGGAPKAEQAVKLDELALPQAEDDLGKAAVWFSRACLSEVPRTVTMAVYNGFGALPGGYPQAEQRAARFLGAAAAQFMDCVRAVKWDEDDSGNSTGPVPGSKVWRGLDLAALRGALLAACREEP